MPGTAAVHRPVSQPVVGGCRDDPVPPSESPAPDCHMLLEEYSQRPQQAWGWLPSCLLTHAAPVQSYEPGS